MPSASGSKSLFELEESLVPLRARSRAITQEFLFDPLASLLFKSSSVLSAVEAHTKIIKVCDADMIFLWDMKNARRPDSEIPEERQRKIRENFIACRQSIFRIMDAITDAVPEQMSLHRKAQQLRVDVLAGSQPAGGP